MLMQVRVKYFYDNDLVQKGPAELRKSSGGTRGPRQLIERHRDGCRGVSVCAILFTC